jgi:hypothetical protein
MFDILLSAEDGLVVVMTRRVLNPPSANIMMALLCSCFVVLAVIEGSFLS